MHLASESECSDGDVEDAVPLKDLLRNAAGSMYVEMRDLLVKLEPMESDERKQALLDYSQRSRHLVLRLLALLRWSSSYGELTMKASLASDLAVAREEAFEDCSAALWKCAHRSRKLIKPYAAVDLATDVLVQGNPSTFPLEVARSVDVRLASREPSEAEIHDRLFRATKFLISMCISAGDLGFHILGTSVVGGAKFVRIGLPRIWSADVLFNSTRIDQAWLKVGGLKIYVRGATSDVEPNWEAPPVISEKQSLLLAKLCEERMKIMVQALSGYERNALMGRILSMLLGLVDVIVGEVCIPLSFEIIQSAARNVAAKNYYNIKLETLGDASSRNPVLVVHYDSGKIIYSMKRPRGRENSGRKAENALITVEHSPALVNMLDMPTGALDPERLDFEDHLRQTMLARQYFRMKQMEHVIVKGGVGKVNAEDVAVTVDKEAQSCSFIVFLRRPSSGVEFRCSQRTAALRVRPFGLALLTIARENYDKIGLWPGEKEFASFPEEVKAVTHVLSTVSRKLQLEAAATAMCVLDVGATRTLPPGTAWVAASSLADPPTTQLVPPFAPLERRAPRRFLTLSAPPSREETKSNAHVFDNSPKPKQRLTYASTSDGLIFIQEGAFPESEDRYSGSAAAAAAWTVAREAVERRLRRDSLLRAFCAASVASPTSMLSPLSHYHESDLDVDTVSRTLLRVKCEPLPVQKAELLLRGNYAWQIRLSLLPAIFDSTDTIQSGDGTVAKGTSWNVGVSCMDSTLTFTYPSANASSVRSFFRDLTRARTAAALAQGVPPSTLYSVVTRSPVRLIVAINPTGSATPETSPYVITVEYVYSKGNSGGFSVAFSPMKPTFEQLAPLVEETLDASGGSVGTVLAGLLERACPIAAAVEASVRERGRGRIRFVTALRVRAIFYAPRPNRRGRTNSQSGPNDNLDIAHAVDVDARDAAGIAKVIDVGRATAIMTAQSLGANKGGANKCKAFVPVPMWDTIVSQMEPEDVSVSICANSTVFLRMERLEVFLTKLVQSANMEPNGPTS